jgi:hypothetical protein
MTLAANIVRLDKRPFEHHPRDVVAFLTVRDEAMRLPAVLEHHRKLGVARFFVLDNGSTDGSLELALDQPDAHVFQTTAGYSDAGYGIAWMNQLLGEHGVGHWCLMIDADELLVYPHVERAGLPRLCEYLDLTGARALFTPMVDMYGAGPVEQQSYSVGESLIEACPYFDPKGYRKVTVPRHCPPHWVGGGMRSRVFRWPENPSGLPPCCLSKVPLMKWSSGTQYIRSAHFISPQPLSELWGALLHFKFMCDLPRRIRDEMSRGQQSGPWAGEYQVYREAIERDPNLTFQFEGSARYTNSSNLIAAKLMRSSEAWDRFVRERVGNGGDAKQL